MSDRTRRTVLGSLGAATGLAAVSTTAGARPPGGRGNGRRVSSDESIQAAVDAASAGERIVIESGEYREQVIVRKDLTLVGRGDVRIVPPSGRLENLSLLRPMVGVAGSETDVRIENVTIDGENRGSGGFFTGIGYFRADGQIRDVAVQNAAFGTFVTQQLGGGGDQHVSITGSRFTSLGREPVIVNERGTTARIVDNTFVGTPGLGQRAVTAGFGASVTLARNEIRDVYGGFGIGFFAFDSADNTVHRNSFRDVAYPVYVLASSTSGFASDAGQSRIVHNEMDGSGLPDGGVSFGTTVFAFDPADDDTTETANNVKIVNNRYANLGTGIATFTEGDGVVQNTKIINNTFQSVGTAIDDNGTATKEAANRVE